jgi:hypothetical protein
MTRNTNYWVATLLGLSGVALSILVPGGPVENRSFAHMNPILLGAFNTFLTILGMGSLLLVYFVFKSERWAMIASGGCGLAYFGVYGLDLAHVFPVSPDAMPPVLLIIEVFGALISLPLMVLAMQGWQWHSETQAALAPPSQAGHTRFVQVPPVIIVMGMTLIGLGIIVFATRSAMGV